MEDNSDHLEAVRQKRALTDLTNSEGWKILAQVFEDQVTRRVNHILYQPLGTEGALYTTVEQQEFGKGEVTGIKSLLAYPAQRIEELAAIIEVYNEHGTEHSGDEPDEPDAGFDSGNAY